MAALDVSIDETPSSDDDALHARWEMKNRYVVTVDLNHTVAPGLRVHAPSPPSFIHLFHPPACLHPPSFIHPTLLLERLHSTLYAHTRVRRVSSSVGTHATSTKRSDHNSRHQQPHPNASADSLTKVNGAASPLNDCHFFGSMMARMFEEW